MDAGAVGPRRVDPAPGEDAGGERPGRRVRLPGVSPSPRAADREPEREPWGLAVAEPEGVSADSRTGPRTGWNSGASSAGARGGPGGEPCKGEPYARFGGGSLETGRRRDHGPISVGTGPKGRKQSSRMQVLPSRPSSTAPAAYPTRMSVGQAASSDMRNSSALRQS